MCAPCFENLLPKALEQSLCSTCAPLCPTCRGQFDAPARRSILAEELVSGATFTVSCGYVACQETVEGRGMKEHMAVCQQREVPCPYSACTEDITLDLVSEHILVHRALMLEVRVNCISFDLDLNGFMNRASGDWSPMVRA